MNLIRTTGESVCHDLKFATEIVFFKTFFLFLLSEINQLTNGLVRSSAPGQILMMMMMMMMMMWAML